MQISRRSLIGYAALGAVALPLTGCGTLLYPERRGQTGGRIDPGVAVLDGVGLLLFLVPGLIAFGIDFSTGAIYLPGTRASTKSDAPEVASVPFDEPLTDDAMDRIWQDHYGAARPFRNEEAQAVPATSATGLVAFSRLAAFTRYA